MVQGVGFRPVRLAAGRTARRSPGGCGTRAASSRSTRRARRTPLDAFAAAHRRRGAAARARRRRRVDARRRRRVSRGFDVEPSRRRRRGDRLVSPDAATCAACLARALRSGRPPLPLPVHQLHRLRPAVHDHRGAARTTASARRCARSRCATTCRREYEDPGDRRFHAEPVACPACGPRSRSLDGGRPTRRRPDRRIASPPTAPRAGRSSRIKGLGGFHLACDATDERRGRAPPRAQAAAGQAVRRDGGATVAAARAWFAPTRGRDRGARVVAGADRAGRRPWRGSRRPSRPGIADMGAMLPSTPLHHLLLRAVDRPARDDERQRERRADLHRERRRARRGSRGIADAFLVHDRAIVARYDDTVVRVRTGRRDRRRCCGAPGRSRPSPIDLALAGGRRRSGSGAAAARRVLPRDRHARAFLSQHIGDLDTEEAMAAYREALARYREVFRVEPELVAHDLHPDFADARGSREALGLPRGRRAAPPRARRRDDGRARAGGRRCSGLAFDGLGPRRRRDDLGRRAAACATRPSYRRVGHLRPVRAARRRRGDARSRGGWRSRTRATRACWTTRSTVLAVRRRLEAGRRAASSESGLASPLDQLGRPPVRRRRRARSASAARATYEGQPAMLLEQRARERAGDGRDRVPVARSADGLARDRHAAAVRGAASTVRGGAGRVGRRRGFHASLGGGRGSGVRASRGTGLDRVVLGGGVFQNDRFTSDAGRAVDGSGLPCVPTQRGAGRRRRDRARPGARRERDGGRRC